MAVSVRKITLWRVEGDNTPGALASKLEPLAQLGADLQVVMGYNMGPQRAVLELNPVVGRKVADAARNVGFSASPTPAVLGACPSNANSRLRDMTIVVYNLH